MFRRRTVNRVDFAILGAGAIGSIVGAHLARSGHQVALLARGSRAAQIRERGLRITGLADIRISVQIIEDPTQLDSADVFIVATKAIDTLAALERVCRAHVGYALSLQNGVMKNDLLKTVFGSARVLGAVANISGELTQSGDVDFTRNANLTIGELGGGVTKRVEELVASLSSSGIHANAHPDIDAVEWSKFSCWVGLMVLSITTRCMTWQFLVDSAAALVLIRIVREIAVLAQAYRVNLLDEAMLPVARIASCNDAEAVDIVRCYGESLRVVAPRHRVSALQDLCAGRPLELTETLGFALQKARTIGVSVPLLESFNDLTTAIDRTTR
jgi:2-dehydropantoate 2-reductase